LDSVSTFAGSTFGGSVFPWLGLTIKICPAALASAEVVAPFLAVATPFLLEFFSMVFLPVFIAVALRFLCYK
jgi:hypothetical protein